MEARLRIAGWAEEVAKALRVRERAADAEAATTVLKQARARHAARMGEAKRWERVRTRILSARRAAAERARKPPPRTTPLDRLGAARVRR